MSGHNDDTRNPNEAEDIPLTDHLQEESASEAPTAEAASPQAQLAEAEARAAENWDQLLRARAEMDNIRKRAEREVSQARKYGLENIARELLPIYDSLNLGLAELDKSEAGLDTAREGMRLITQMMTKVFEQHAIVEIDPTGEPFDPEAHQAMSMQETAEQAPNTVLQVVQKGYRLNDRVLRPAMVIVARAPQAPADADENSQGGAS